MNTTRRAVLTAVAGAALTAGCAAGGIVEGQLRPKGAAYAVNLQRQWSDVTFMLMPRPPGVQMLTVDGIALNRLYLAGLEPGQSLVRPRDRDTPVPTYRADMSDTEMVELVIDCLAQEFQQPQSTSLRPQNLGATPGVRFDLTARTSTGLDLSGTALVAKRDDKMQLLLYMAPTEHYYASLLPNVEAIFASAT